MANEPPTQEGIGKWQAEILTWPVRWLSRRSRGCKMLGYKRRPSIISSTSEFASPIGCENPIWVIRPSDRVCLSCVYLLGENRQERNRTTSSSNVDDYTTHMHYLPPFLKAVQAGVASVMCSYNLINSSYACQVSIESSRIERCRSTRG